MAWLRVLVVLLLIGGTASAKRRPPSDPDLMDELGDRVGAPRMRPPPMDENEMLQRRLAMALGRSTMGVQACADRFGMQIERLEVRVTVGMDTPVIQVPQFRAMRFQACVKRAIAESLRTTFGVRFRHRPAIGTTYRFTLQPRRRLEGGFSQPPPG